MGCIHQPKSAEFDCTLMALRHYSRVPKKDAKTKLTKDIKTIYLSTDVSRKLRKAAQAEGMSQSIYVEQTLRARFKKDGIE
jgi:hypothetical protein